LNRAVIILAGGLSKRFGQDKCLKELAGKPLLLHVLERVEKLADEVLIVVGSKRQQDALLTIGGLKAAIVVDKYKDHNPLVGALTGFETVKADCALLLPCDAAFVSAEIATLLLDLCEDRSAVIPRWPNGYVEPLQAAYNVKSAVNAAKTALREEKHDMLSMIADLQRVRYVSTLVLKQYDERLTTFFNINTVQDWKRAEAEARRRR
jgi:molybdopterin-guanine dinucleotide biosynthesis protein A